MASSFTTPTRRARVASPRIDQFVGDTPLVRLSRVVPEGAGEVWVKVEGANPGGSIKDRTARAMIDDAEARGLLRPGGTIVEPTSGNTGVGLALVAAARGYRLILCMPASMSDERKRTLRALGAELVLTDPRTRMLAAIEEARRIRDREGAYFPDQFANPANPRVHYETTGPELLRGMAGRVDAFVYGSGTGGTISGVGRYLKERVPGVRVQAVEPAGSAVISGGKRGPHGFQGMGPGFLPDNLDQSVIDDVTTATEDEAFPFARRLAREEGLFVGMSSGAIVGAAVRLAAALGPGSRVACIAPDSGARYLSTELFSELSD